MNDGQKIAFDLGIFEEIFTKPPNNEYSPVGELYILYLLIAEYHEIACNRKWLSEIENLKVSILDQNIHDSFSQLFLRNSNIKYFDTGNKTENDDYIYFIAKSLPQKILVSDNIDAQKQKVKTYRKSEFLSTEYSPDCSLFRLPKKTEYLSKSVLNDFNFLGHYFTGCTEIEFFDPYLLKPEFNSSLEFVFSILSQINQDVKIRFHLDIKESYKPKYKKFCENISSTYPNMKILPELNYNTENNHDRFIIVNNNKYSIRFTTSFNNIKKLGNTFIIKKNFSIIITSGRKYEDS